MSNQNQRKNNFYIVGGTMHPEAPSYIERKADNELHEHTLAGDFCYVLTPRQMGKSSLMVRTADRLNKEGIRTAIVDLTQIGAEHEKKSADRWYYGIAYRIAQKLDIKINLSYWWEKHEKLPALQRLTEFFESVVLAKVKKRIVIFVDEIDTTIALPFTDDFFAAIRACHNARATQSEYRRLSFVLLGVATPSQLIKDIRRTPFNIGHRIDLTDFSFIEARPLIFGLGLKNRKGKEALKRILYWTGGHPYLTQKLCRLVADEKIESYSDEYIDSLSDKHFLSPGMIHEDSNLDYVYNRLKNNAEVLKLYRSIYRGNLVYDNPLSTIHSILKLSGLIEIQKNRQLRIRNRLYKNIFTVKWVKEVIPSNWERNIFIASYSILSFCFFIVYILFLPLEHIKTILSAKSTIPTFSYNQLRKIPGYSNKANELLADYWERRARDEEIRGKQKFALIYRLKALTVKPTEKRRREVQRLLERNDEDKGFVASYRHGEDVHAAAFSQDGNMILISSDTKTNLLGLEKNKLRNYLVIYDNNVHAVAFSPNINPSFFLIGNDYGIAQLWIGYRGYRYYKEQDIKHHFPIRAVCFSPNGDTILIGSANGIAMLYNANSGESIGSSMKHKSAVTDVAFSPNGKMVLVGISDGTAKLWSRSSDDKGRLIGYPLSSSYSILSVAFSPNSKIIITGSSDGTVQLWRVETSERLGKNLFFGSDIKTVTFSPDGKTIIAATDRRILQASLSGGELEPKASRRLPGNWTGAYRFLDKEGNEVQVALKSEEGYIKIYNLRFDIPDAPPIEGDPDKLMEHWQKKLNLKLNEDGMIEPM